jgi:hypothetical protein
MIEDEGRARVQRKRGEQKGKSAEEEGREGGGGQNYTVELYIYCTVNTPPRPVRFKLI